MSNVWIVGVLLAGYQQQFGFMFHDEGNARTAFHTVNSARNESDDVEIRDDYNRQLSINGKNILAVMLNSTEDDLKSQSRIKTLETYANIDLQNALQNDPLIRAKQAVSGGLPQIQLGGQNRRN